MPSLGPGAAASWSGAVNGKPPEPGGAGGSRGEWKPPDATALEDVLHRLDRELVALHDVKERIRELGALLFVDRLRRGQGLESEPPTLHMCFTGNPGTGKTTVARHMGQVLYELGYVRRGHLVHVTREDLVGQYVGHTAPRTREVLKRAMGGVLFIDEAYLIYRPQNDRDYGQETVEILLQGMEDARHDLVVIFAGYKDKMERFFREVPGISSRIAHHIDFPDYSGSELMEIAERMLAAQGYRFSPDASEAFRGYLERRRRQPNLANGRSVRNAIDRARLRQAARLYEAHQAGRLLGRDELVTLEAEDITKSRVFTESEVVGAASGAGTPD